MYVLSPFTLTTATSEIASGNLNVAVISKVNGDELWVLNKEKFNLNEMIIEI